MGHGDRDRERATLAKAKMELEALYLGIPDESVNLTFQDFADVQQRHNNHHQPAAAASASESKEKNLKEDKPPLATTLLEFDSIHEGANTPSNNNTRRAADGDLIVDRSLLVSNPMVNSSPSSIPLRHHDVVVKDDKVPSQLYQSSNLHGSNGGHQYHHHQLEHYQTGNVIGSDHMMVDDSYNYNACSRGHHRHSNLPAHHHHHSDRGLSDNNSKDRNFYNPYGGYDDNGHGHGHDHANVRRAVSSMAAYEDASIYSNYSQIERSGVARSRRPGIPHSNICTVCSTYIYIFRHRCLVCGRVYCRQCVSIGMGEMTEGRKCIECLGRRFSLRYIKRAGKVGCFCFGYGSEVKRAELKWAEKGPRRSGGERGYGRRSRSLTALHHAASQSQTQSRSYPAVGTNHSNPHSFVIGSPSPYSSPTAANHHFLPF